MSRASHLGALWNVGFAVASIGMIALPIAIAVAVLRYQLYAIDLILNRAALYAGLSLILAAGFAVATSLSQRALEATTAQRSDLVLVIAAVLLALAFQPLRQRAIVVVDRILPARVERALVFGDIVGSTERVADLGDVAWRETLTQYRATIRRELRRHHGVEVHAAGDGFFATFGDPVQAVACAQALAPQLRQLGVPTRFGLHWGLCEVRGEEVTGLEVWVAARVMSAAGPSEILVSEAMRNMLEAVGTTLSLKDGGVRNLTGLPGEWQLHTLAEARRSSSLPTNRY